MSLGLDFGTSNSVAAIARSEGVDVLPLDPVAGPVMPSLLYLRNDGARVVGQAAIDAYLAGNRARGPVEREYKLLGIRMASSNPRQGDGVEAMILADTSSPGRLFQSLKTFLGDPLVGATTVFGSPQDLTQLVAMVLGHIRERVQSLTGAAPTAVTIGRPVEFIGGPSAESLALGRLDEAAHLAGFHGVRFVAEPIGAAYAARVGPGVSLVFDFGGGTLDLCLVERLGTGALRVLATAGRPVGGDMCTEALIGDSVAPWFGSRSTWSEKRLPLPRYLVDAVRNWHALSALNERPVLDVIDDLVRMGAPARQLRALRSAIELQLGYAIFSEVDKTKRELSSQTLAFFTFHEGEVDVDAQVNRYRFEQLIKPILDQAASGIDEVLQRAGARSSDVATVICTGGTSAMPSVEALLRRTLPSAEHRQLDLFTSVATGLARTSADLA